MGQVLKIRHCVLKIKVNTNLIVRTGPNKAYIILQLKFYHHSGSSNSESQFQVLTLQVQVQVQVLTVQVQVQVQVLGLRVQVQSKSSRNRTRVRLESKSRTRVLQLWAFDINQFWREICLRIEKRDACCWFIAWFIYWCTLYTAYRNSQKIVDNLDKFSWSTNVECRTIELDFPHLHRRRPEVELQILDRFVQP